MIPLKYNLRNLKVRGVTTLMTMLGTGMIVWSSCIIFGLVDGLKHSLKLSADPLDLIIIRKGATNEINGGFELDRADLIATLPGIAEKEFSQALRPLAGGSEGSVKLVASELVNIPVVKRVDGTSTNLIVRGVSDGSPYLRPDFKIVDGRYLRPGLGECVVSKSIAGRFRGETEGGPLKVGETLRVGLREAYKVVGLFTAGGSAAESEVWVDRIELEKKIGREGSVSCVQLRATNQNSLQSLVKTIEGDAQFRLQAKKESVYYGEQTNTSTVLTVTGTIIAFFLTIGAMFAAANTMFAAVSARTREIGTMRAIGFSRLDILLSFMGESIIICFIGGVVGLLAAIPLNAFTFGVNNIDAFSELNVNFRLGPAVLITACAMTAAMGVLGGLFPAIRAVRLEIVKALREL